MSISRYPRPGQRIAPLTLQEISVPSGLLRTVDERFQKLSDLDETLWEFEGAATCKVMANLVVHKVRQSLNSISTAVRILQLSEISPRIPLRALDLEVRTYNCLKEKFGLDVPGSVRIRDLLKLAGFGARTLVDFLVALEAFSSRPARLEQLELRMVSATRKESIPTSELPSQFRVEISRYPRKGYRIAPRTIATLLDAPAKDRRMEGLILRDLDESAWERFHPKICYKLALEVVNRVKRYRSTLRQLGGTLLPMPRTRGKPAILQLERRTFNCLNDAGLLNDPVRLAQTTISDLLAMTGFGDKCLVDLLCALETQAGSDVPMIQEVVTAAHRLENLKDSASIRIDDPRFGLMIQSLAVPGENLKVIAEEIARSKTCTSATRRFAQRIQEILGKIRISRHLRLEQELAELLTIDPRLRNRELAAAFLGWNGEGTHTLGEVGMRYGVTRERVRQITQRLVETLKAKRPFAPVLGRVLQAIAAEIPCPVEWLERVLAERKLVTERFLFGGIITAAEIVGLPCPFVIEEADGVQYAVPHDQKGVPKTVLQVTRKSVSHWGAATIEDIAAQVSETIQREIATAFVRSVLSTQPGFSWLDESSGWFWINNTTRNALLNQIQKVMAVAPRIHISELRAGVSRHHRREGFAPPQRVLIALCAQAEGYAIEGDCVLARPPRDYHDIVSNTESIMVDVLRAHGPIMPKPKLEELCVERGLHRDTFSIHLTYSPIIARYATGVYGLRGAQVPPGLAESMAQTRKKTRALADYGWLPDGKISLSYKLSKGSLATGIATVPSGMKSYLQGEFRLLIGDGQQAGRLVVKGTHAWGLGPFFRRRGGEPGDILTIRFDLKQRLAIVELGDEPSDDSKVKSDHC